MEELKALNVLYGQLLHLGFVVLRQAVHSGDNEWVRAEIDLLHNLPSLIGESNIERHRYFWFVERDLYVKWVSAPGRDEPRSRMRTYYEPIWLEMEPVLLRMLERRSATNKAAVLDDEAAVSRRRDEEVIVP